MRHWRELDREIRAHRGGGAWRRTWSFWAYFHLSGNVIIASLIPLPVLPVFLLNDYLLHELMGHYQAPAGGIFIRFFWCLCCVVFFGVSFGFWCFFFSPHPTPPFSPPVIRTAVLSNTKDSVV